MARALLIISEGPLKRTSELWKGVESFYEVEYVHVDRARGRLRHFIENNDFRKYYRVVFQSGLRRAGEDALALSKLSNLIVYDFDLGQEILKKSPYYKKLIPLAKTFGKCRLVLTSKIATDHFRSAGVTCSYLPKAYDSRIIKDEKAERRLELGYIGRLKNDIYYSRKKFLQKVSREFPLTVLRTTDASLDNSDYNKALNSIKCFLIPDFDIYEYMQKNFEAMAAGCLVMTVPTTPQESSYLGFSDMENIVFFRSYSEFKQKFTTLLNDPVKVKTIAEKGRELAVKRHSWQKRVDEMCSILEEPLEEPQAHSLAERLRLAQLKLMFKIN